MTDRNKLSAHFPQADVVKRLDAIDTKLEQLLAAALGTQAPVRPLRRQDLAAMAKILPVLATHFPGVFATWELVDAAEARDAAAANLRLVLAGMTAQQLGKLFKRAADQEIAGHRLRRVSRDGNGTRWQCDVIASP